MWETAHNVVRGVPCRPPTLCLAPQNNLKQAGFVILGRSFPTCSGGTRRTQKNKHIHLGCFQEETAQNREGGTLLGKSPTASRVIKSAAKK